MYSKKTCIYGFLVAILAWCQAESFSIGARVARARSSYSQFKRQSSIIDFQLNAFAQIRGGGIVSSAKSVWETLPKQIIHNNFANMLHSFVDPAITGGLLSGGLHAVTGPDHLAALIAPSVGKSGLHGLKIGALWGVGHGFTAITLGLCAYFLKGQFTGRLAVVSKLSTLAESIVGLSILYIGLMGIKESRDAELEAAHSTSGFQFNHSELQQNNSEPSSAAPTNSPDNVPSTRTSATSYRAILANGMLHGFSWDGVPSLAPAVTMTTWTGALSFLTAYSLGTVVAMSLAAGTMGELSTRVGKASNNPDLPRKLSFASSVAAVTIGVYLTAKSIFFRQ